MSDRFSKAILLLTSATMACTIVGCGFPIVIFPAPCVASGQELRFQDKNGRLIQQDGLLLVNRYQGIYTLAFELDCAPSNHVVKIRDGRARIPHEWVPALVWLWQHEMGLAMGFSHLLSEPIPALEFLLVGVIPRPVVQPDEDVVYLIPLVPGYHMQTCIDEPYAEGPVSARKRNGNIVLIPNSESPSNARLYWDVVRRHLRRRFESSHREFGPDLRLNHYYYPRVKSFILRELQRIKLMESGPPPTSRPAGHRRIPIAPESEPTP